MAVVRSRTRLVTFRLSVAEYQALNEVCAAEGARSISAYARDAVMQRMALHGMKRVSLGDDLNTLGIRLEELDSRLRDLRGSIAKVRGPQAWANGTSSDC